MAKLDRRLKYIIGKEYVPTESVTLLAVEKETVTVCDTLRPTDVWKMKKDTFKGIYDLKRS